MGLRKALTKERDNPFIDGLFDGPMSVIYEFTGNTEKEYQ
ncbi:hypothetical protein BMS3Abin17_01400 [archaeon BMS3Abin17]|nr:hypothetical protein BMS3Abin17_01400 [archaeon BMS3Abin17]